MTARFPQGIAILNNTIKTKLEYCDVPTNKLFTNVLRLLRDHGYLWGFSTVSPRKRTAPLYPRVKIYIKYRHPEDPIIKAIRPFKKTRSNFKFIRHKDLFKYIAQNKLFIVSTTKGLAITSISHLYQEYNKKTRMKNPRFAGKLLAELFI